MPFFKNDKTIFLILLNFIINIINKLFFHTTRRVPSGKLSKFGRARVMPFWEKNGSGISGIDAYLVKSGGHGYRANARPITRL